MVNIPLSGVIDSLGTIVISNTLCDMYLHQISDVLNSSIDFENYLYISLKNHNAVIDKFGSNNNSIGTFDLYSYYQNPYSYLNSIDIDLNDFSNIDLIRGRMIHKGDPNFSYGDSTFWGVWFLNTELDKSNLGIHSSDCEPLAAPTAGFHYAGNNLFCNSRVSSFPVKVQNGLQGNYDLTITVLPNEPIPNNYPHLIFGSQNLGYQAYFQYNPSGLSETQSYYVSSAYAQARTHAVLGPNDFSDPFRGIMYELSSPNNDVKIDLSSYRWLLLGEGCETNDLVETQIVV